MIVRRTPNAARDLERLHDVLAAHYKAAAKAAISLLYDRVEALADVDGRQPRLKGTKFSKLSVPPYIALFVMRDGVVEIARLHHARENWRTP